MARRLAVLGAVAAVLLAAAPPASACTRWASSRGSDDSAGTASAPFRTVARLLRALPDGGVGCLAAGSTFREHVKIERPATLRGAGGRATIVGGVFVARHVPNATVANLRIRGAGYGGAAVYVRGDRARIVGNDISGVGFFNRNTACVLLDGVRGVVVDGNVIHTCTRATRRQFYAPGIFVRSALRARITHNVVHHTLGDGIALAPNAQRTHVSRNIVDGGVSGIYIGGNRRTASSYNVVTRNVISNNGRWNVHAAWSGPVGRGNVVTGNCLWHGFGGNFAGTGFSRSGNVVASPRFRNRPQTYAMRPGRCAAMRPRTVSVSVPRLPRFVVAYRLRGLPDRVQVVRLSVRGVAAGATVSVRCARGCTARWSGRAPASTLALPVLGGRWLRRGAVVEVRATRGGWAGHYARVVVTGLPRGVRIEHACLPPGGFAPVSCARYGGA